MMTGYKARSSRKTPKGYNKKDGATGRARRNESQDVQFEKLGFEMCDWNKWSYTWPGDFPVIRLVSGVVDWMPGWVAVCEDGRRIPIGQASPAEIKARLDDEILAIMRYEAELAEAPIDWQPDEIGPEIDIDLWMTRPQAARRQSTPAVRDLAKRHSISIPLADEMLQERGQ